MSATGTTQVDFGTGKGGTKATVTITGQTNIQSTSLIEAFMMSDGTGSDHNSYEHSFVPIILRCGNIVPGVSFDITATCLYLSLTGKWNVKWVWN